MTLTFSLHDIIGWLIALLSIGITIIGLIVGLARWLFPKVGELTAQIGTIADLCGWKKCAERRIDALESDVSRNTARIGSLECEKPGERLTKLEVDMGKTTVRIGNLEHEVFDHKKT